MKWKSFKSAPKHGLEFLVCDINVGSVLQIMRWDKVHNHWQIKGVADVYPQWTHWTPIVNVPQRTL